MTKVIAFSPERSRLLPRRREGGAEILFFTGVRYVREPDLDQVLPPSEVASPVRKARMRSEDLGQDQVERLLA